MMEIINMGWGHPSYMKDYWRGTGLGTFIGFDSGIYYQLDAGNPSLIDAIRELHESEGNAETEGRHIVVGVGATQIIRALMSRSAAVACFAQTPYYSRFPVTAIKEGLEFFTEKNISLDRLDSVMEITTTPNNPDGLRKKPHLAAKLHVFDLCYNWPQYGNVEKSDYDNMVFSLSKATGHAGSRIGWGIFRDKQIADQVQSFIELDTCGVSADAQTKALSLVLDQLKRPKNKRCFHFGRYELKYRWAKLKQVAANYDFFEVVNRLGMFALIRSVDFSAYDVFLDRFKVEGVRGGSFGMDDSYLRINIGCNTEDFDTFINRLEV